MAFNSLLFAVFFPLVAIVLFCLPKRLQWIWLFAASCLFYATFVPYFIILLFGITFISYASGLLIENNREKLGNYSQYYLLAGIVLSILLVLLFKYLNFLSKVTIDIAHILNLQYPGFILNIAVPLGISFYTLQTIGYTIDVYHGVCKPERHLGYFALSVSFFPQIMAGPLSRINNLFHQFRKEFRFETSRVSEGLLLMGWGYFKKMVIADRAAVMVNEVYNSPREYWGVFLIVATLLFSIQLYADFSGYSDIAIGAARILGIDIGSNFKRPFLAETISELWRRWHTSLHEWWKQYLYIPLGGNRVFNSRWHLNILIVFLISGLWHGPDWKFVCWAGIHAWYVLFSQWTKQIRSAIIAFVKIEKFTIVYKTIRILITFILFAIAGIFFRANSISDAVFIVKNSFYGLDVVMRCIIAMDYENIKSALMNQQKITILGFTKPAFISEIIVLMLAVFLLLTIEIYLEMHSSTKILRISNRPWYVRWTLYFVLIFSIFFLGMFSGQPFIYF